MTAPAQAVSAGQGGKRGRVPVHKVPPCYRWGHAGGWAVGLLCRLQAQPAAHGEAAVGRGAPATDFSVDG